MKAAAPMAITPNTEYIQIPREPVWGRLKPWVFTTVSVIRKIYSI